MATVETLKALVEEKFSSFGMTTKINLDELTVEVPKKHIHEICLALRDMADFHFEQLMDLCGVDYSTYGKTEWVTEDATFTGFSRAVENSVEDKSSATPGMRSVSVKWEKPRFAVVYHLLSLRHNHRLRLKAFVEENDLLIDSVINIWNVANFFEREAFDMYGILFNGHPDLRRVLTDYGFIGHPFRKDFPLSGYVEPRYDATLQRVVYEPVDIQPRVLVPRVIRKDNRYLGHERGQTKPE